MKSKVVFEEPVDKQGDVIATAIRSEDYNGDPLITVLVCGFPVLVIRAKSEVITLNPESLTSDHAQSLASLYWHLGEVSEEDYCAYTDLMDSKDHAVVQKAWEKMTENMDGHEFCLFVDRIVEANAKHEEK